MLPRPGKPLKLTLEFTNTSLVKDFRVTPFLLQKPGLTLTFLQKKGRPN